MNTAPVLFLMLCVVHAQARSFSPAYIADAKVAIPVRHRTLLHMLEAATTGSRTLPAAEHSSLARRLLGAYAWSNPNGMIDHGKSISTETSDTINQQAAEDAIKAAVNSVDANPSQPSWSQPQLALGKKVGDASAVVDQSTAEQQIQSLQGGRKLRQAPTPSWSDAYAETAHAQDTTADAVDMAAEGSVEDQISSAADTEPVRYKSLDSTNSGRRFLRGVNSVAWSDPNAEMHHGKSISADTSDTIDQENVEDQIDAAESTETVAGVQQVDKASGISNDDYNK